MGIREQNEQMENREQMVWGGDKKQSSFLRGEYYRDEIKRINPYISVAPGGSETV